MIDYDAIQEAIRARLLTLEVATTGSTTLSATSTGYARTSGSFLDDGFRAGMELSASGFANAANNGTKVVTQATALALSCAGTSAEPAGAGRTLTVGLPSVRFWENEEDADKEPDVPWFREQFLPGPLEQFTTGGFRGKLRLEPLYTVHINTPAGWGKDAGRRYTDAVLNHFRPLTSLDVDGTALVVRTQPGPFPGQLIHSHPGFVTVPATIPFRTEPLNS